MQGIHKGVVQPLHAHVFEAAEVEAAFRFMANGKHIGKVVLNIRKEEQGQCLPKPVLVNATPRVQCSPRHVYLITGGLGGFGLELANWLSKRGARK